MPSARAIRAGAAYVELTANDNKLVRGLKRAQRRLRAFSASTREVGKRMAAMSAVFATPFIAGVKVFADFEQQMANVSTMLKDPTMHITEFRREIRRMSSEFGESTETLAGGLYDILSASIPAEKALGVLAVAARAAKAGLTDTATSADAITTVLNSYGLEAENAAVVSDLLFSIVRRGKTTFAELAPSIGNVANIAATAGVGLDEMGASIALLTRNGIKTEDAITALRAIMTSFLKPSKEASELAKELGFEMNTATLKSESLAGVFERISKLPPDAVAKLFPNIRALKGVLPALANMEGFADDIDAMQSSAGATETAYKKMTNTLMHSFNQLKQSAIGVLSVLGEAIAEPIGKATKVIKRYVGVVRELIVKNKGLVIAALKVVLAIGLLGASLVVLGTAGAAMAFVFGGIASIIAGVGTAIGILGTILAALLSPIGLVISGMVALASYILYATGTGAKALKWLGEKFEALKNIASQAWQGIGDALAAGDIALAAKILWLTLQMEWKKGINSLNAMWIKFKEFFMSIATNAFFGVVAVLAEAWAGMQVAWVETVTFLANIWTGFTLGITKAWNETQGFLAKGWIELMGLFDEGLEVDVIKKSIDDDTDRQNSRITEEAGRTLAERERKRQEKRQEIEREREGTLVAIGEMANEEDRARREKYKDDLQKSEDELNKARQEWREAIAEAGKKKIDSDTSDAGPEKQDKPEVDIVDVLGKLKNKLTGVTSYLDGVDKKTQKLDVAGTFNAAAIRGLTPGGTQERTAKATEETAKNTKKIVKEMGESSLVFG